MTGAFLPISAASNGVLWDDILGRAIADRAVYVYKRHTTTEVDLFTDDTGAVPLAQPVRSKFNGALPGYAQSPQSVDFYDTITQETVEAEIISGDDVAALVIGGVTPEQVGPRLIDLTPSGGDDAPALNYLFASLALAAFNESNFQKTVSYLSNYRWIIDTPVSLDWKLVGLVADAAVFDARGFTTDSVTMTVHVTNGSTRVTIVSTNNPAWNPVQGLKVTCSAFTGTPYISTGTCFTPGGLLSSTQGIVGAQFDLSTPATAATGNYTLKPIMDAAVVLGGGADAEDGAQSWGDSSQTTERIQLIGPVPFGTGAALAALVGTDRYFTGIRFGGPNFTGNAGPAHKALQHFSIRGFGVGMEMGSNGYLLHSKDFDIFNNYVGINIPFAGIANAGEGVRFSDGALFGNCFDVICASPGTDLHFTRVSFDYGVDSGSPSGNPVNGRQRKIQVFKGRVFCVGCHFEDNNDIDWWFTVNDPTTSLIITSSDFTVASTKTAYELALSVSDPTQANRSAGLGGVTIRDCHLNGVSAQYLLGALVGGRGRAVVENIHTEIAALFAGLVTKSPYAPGSRWRSPADHSFGITWQQMTCDCNSGNATIAVTGGVGISAPSNGATAYCPGVLPPGTTVLDNSGYPNVILSAPPSVTNHAAFVFFDSTASSTSRELNQWDTTGSTGSSDKPTVTTILADRTTTSDGFGLNALKLKPNANGNTSSAKRYFPCSPNQTGQISMKVRSKNFGANGDSLKLNLTFIDKTGQGIGSLITYAFWPAWQATTHYLAGAIVTNGGNVYEAIADFTSGGSFNPANWALLTDADTGYFVKLIFPTVVPQAAVSMLAEWKLTGNAGSIGYVSDLVVEFDGPGQSPQGTEAPGQKLLAGSNLADVANPTTALGNLMPAIASIPQAVIDQLMPWQPPPVIPLLDASAADDKVGTWTTFASSSALLNGWLFNSTAAQNDRIGWNFNLAKGTWEIGIIFVGNTDAGIITVLLDGAAVGSTIDTYRSAVSYNLQSAISIGAVAASGKHLIALKMASKNASATAYKLNLLMIRMRRTA